LFKRLFLPPLQGTWRADKEDSLRISWRNKPVHMGRACSFSSFLKEENKNLN
jgi:hypothetical protein